MENIVTSDMVLVPDDPLVTCTINLTGTPSTKVKAVGSGVCADGFTIAVSGITYPSAGATTPDPTTYTVALNSTATKNKAEGSLVLLEGDESDTIDAVPVIPGSPPTSYNVSFKVVITGAGQTKVKGV